MIVPATATRGAVLVTWLFALLCVLACAEYNETLTLRPLQNGNKVLAHFRFSTHEPVRPTTAATSSHTFPKVLRQILTKYDAESLHLTLALGKHSDARYGTAYGVGSDALAHAPFGARLQVRLREVDSGESIAESASVQERWRGITAELGAIFSASLNQMGLTVVTDLSHVDGNALGAFPFATPTATNTTSQFLHAALAREEICTENLTPWLKMLPCRAHAGLGKLIDPIQILSGEFLSLSLFASRLFQSTGTDDAWVLQQQLVTVQTLRATERARWSLESLFFSNSQSNEDEHEMLDACPLATESVVFTETPRDGFALQHTPDATTIEPLPIDATSHKSFRAPVVYASNLQTHPRRLSDVWLAQTDATAADAPQKSRRTARPRDLVTVHRFVTGYGQVHGGIAVRLENNHPACAMRVTYHDVVPWYFRLYFSTFQIKATRSVGSHASGTEHLDAQALLETVQFVPAEMRGRPNEMHLELLLPANASIVFSVQLEKAFLRLSEHPPDANRGFDVAAGVATFVPVVSSDSDVLCHALEADVYAFTRTLFTEPLLVPLPTPDFSMPYNVITMTSTVVAFFVGSMLNTLLRKPARIKQLIAPED